VKNKLTIIILFFFVFFVNVKLNSKENKYKQEIIKYTKIIKSDPKAHWAYESIGYEYFLQKNFNKAAKNFKIAIKIKPKPEYYSQLGEAYIAMGRYNKAILELQKALKLEDAYEYYCIRALAYDMLGQYKKAFKDYSVYLDQKNFTYEEFHLVYIVSARLAIFNINKKEYNKAMKNTEMAIKVSKAPGGIFKNPSDDIFYIKFLINLKLNKFEEAKNDLLIVLRNGFNNKKRINSDIKGIKKDYKIEIEKIIKKNMTKSKKLNDIDFYDKKYLVNKFLGFE